MSAIDSGSAYARAGVYIDAKMRALKLMTEAVRSTYGPEVLAGMGSFGGLFSAAALRDMREPVLVASTDGVGTKTALAARVGRYAGLGEDIVNHSINDILVQGARPLFFLDYVAASRLQAEMIAEIVAGVAKGCREAGCALLGGETAEMPGVYHQGEFDIAGTIVGVVERSEIIDGRDIVPGDQLIGLPSSGPHTNGYSLIRQVFAEADLAATVPELGATLAEALLAPHHSYLPEVNRMREGVRVKGLAHITGGGFYDNIPRILPAGVGVVVRRGTWTVPPVFGMIQRLGSVPEEEMFRVFNMGIGMVAVVSGGELNRALALVGPGAAHIGEVVPREGAVVQLA